MKFESKGIALTYFQIVSIKEDGSRTITTLDANVARSEARTRKGIR